jgi:hypothetical protein
MLWLQRTLLKITGILPLSDTKPLLIRPTITYRLLSMFLMAIAVSLLLGTLFSSCLQGAISLFGFFNPSQSNFTSSSTSMRNFLHVLQLMAYFSINMRGIFVLFLLFIKRNAWIGLMRDTSDFVHMLYPSSYLNRYEKRIQTASVLLCLLTTSLHFSWEVAEWFHFLIRNPNMTMTSDEYLAPIPMKFSLLQSIIIWSIFSVFPFVLSQQVHSCIILLALILSDAIKGMHQQIDQVTEHFRELNRNVMPPRDEDIKMVEQKVTNWNKCHTQMLFFCQRINDFFGLILFVVYGLDFMTSVSFASGVVETEGLSLEGYTFLVTSVLIFLSYGTVFLFPLVLFNEKVSIVCLRK